MVGLVLNFKTTSNLVHDVSGKLVFFTIVPSLDLQGLSWDGLFFHCIRFKYVVNAVKLEFSLLYICDTEVFVFTNRQATM